MKRSIKNGLATMALVGTVALGGAALTPILVSAKAGDKTFTHSFKQASAQEVLAWMKGQGLNVQVSPSDLPSKKMSFAFDGLKPDELVGTFGRMVGLRTEKRGDVYSLLRGVGGDGPAERLGSEESAQDPCPTWEKALIELEMQDPEFDFDFEGFYEPFGQNANQLVEEIMKALDEAGVFSGKKLDESEKRALKERLAEKISRMHGGAFFGPEGGMFRMMPGKEGFEGVYRFDPEHMKQFGQDHQKAMEGLHRHMEELQKQGKLHGMDKEAMAKAHAEMRRAMEEMHKGGMFQKLTPEQLEKMKAEGKVHFLDQEHMRKMMEEMHKGGMFQKLTPEQLERMKAEGKVQFLDQEHMRKMMEEMHKGGMFQKLTPEQLEKMKAEGKFFDGELFRKNMEEWQKKFGEDMKVMQLKLENVKKFIASLTPAQKELAEKQGYLRPEDLTKAQRELIGIEGKSGVDLQFHIDGQKIVIKGSDKAKTTGGGSERRGIVTA